MKFFNKNLNNNGIKNKNNYQSHLSVYLNWNIKFIISLTAPKPIIESIKLLEMGGCIHKMDKKKIKKA